MSNPHVSGKAQDEASEAAPQARQIVARSFDVTVHVRLEQEQGLERADVAGARPCRP
jgi:hypothetical protein